MALTSRLVTQLEEQVGDALRVVATYDTDGYTLASVRSDLDPDRVHGRIGLLYTNLVAPDHGSEPALDRDLGPQQATVYVRTRAVFLRLPISDTSGMLVGVDPEFSEDFVDLIDLVRSQLDHRDSPPDEQVSTTGSS
ncbi:MAG: hypothetical protein ABEJ48_08185 [Halobacteriales archaeon]